MVTVGDIRKLIEDMPDDVEVTIFLPENCKPESKYDYMRQVQVAKDRKASPISDRELELTAGKYFAY